jgi:cytochrome c oxidase accessory protein FixG
MEKTTNTDALPAAKPGKRVQPQVMSVYTEEEAFRDTIGTLQNDGKRKWIYAKKPKGRYTNMRHVLALVLLGLLFAMPFIKINGQPFLMLNIIERKFVVFGQPFWPQDFYLFALLFISGVLFIAVFTILFGRLFCGWVCPQTVFMEFVFRRVEYWLEGDYQQQRARDNDPLTFDKAWRKAVKHVIFFAFAWLIGNTFLAYIIGVDQLQKIVTSPPTEHLAGFIAMIGFSAAFYFVFAFFREQACIVACPYGRLQGVLLGPKSIVVAYDHTRGEPRGVLRKDETERTLGDCIACNQCVYVCPTGIDIRNGTQLECVNCTACMDACDDIMDRVGFNRGLVRYTSKYSLSTGKPFSFSPRALGYMAVLVILLTTSGFLIFNRSEVDGTLLRMPGTLYQTQPDGTVSNIYQFKVVNKTLNKRTIRFVLEGAPATIDISGATQHDGVIDVPADGLAQGMLIVKVKRDDLKTMNTKLTANLLMQTETDDAHAEKLIKRIHTNFLGPTPQLKK